MRSTASSRGVVNRLNSIMSTVSQQRMLSSSERFQTLSSFSAAGSKLARTQQQKGNHQNWKRQSHQHQQRRHFAGFEPEYEISTTSKVIGVAVFVAAAGYAVHLGNWQMQRSDWKAGLIKYRQKRMKMDPVDIDDIVEYV